MSVAFRDSYSPLTTDELNATELRLGIPFPESYRQFLLVHNGGRPRPNVFRTDDGHLEMVDWFLGIHEGEHDNLLRYLEWYKNRIPTDLLPIGHDAGGNLILIGIIGVNLGKIFFWDHEKEDSDSRVGYDNIIEIAESLDAFLASLKDIDDFTDSNVS
ncbi:SMI1/KNR4 family protein [bacterium]|nr:SMI1/KNR4 family protein [bacterium]